MIRFMNSPRARVVHNTSQDAESLTQSSLQLVKVVSEFTLAEAA